MAFTYLELGEVNLSKPITAGKLLQLSKALHAWGLELMHDKNAILNEKIKNIIIEMVYYADELPMNCASPILKPVACYKTNWNT